MQRWMRKAVIDIYWTHRLEARMLAQLDTFGDVAAEDDAIMNYFLSTDAVRSLRENKVFLVLGRKGSGKTAIVRFFTEQKDGSPSAQLNLRNYPWAVHSQKIDHGASDIEAYVSSWRYLISVQLAALTLSQCSERSHDSARMLSQYLKDNYGGISPTLADVLRPQRLQITAWSVKPSIMGNQLGGVDLSRAGKDHVFGLELNALSASLLSAVVAISKDLKLPSMSLHFDELDQGLSKFDENRSKMLIGLILAARGIKRECEALSCSINPIVYLRTDLWEDMDFSDKNKISSSSTMHLNWNNASLLDLVNTRLGAKLGKGVSWQNIIDEQRMRGSQEKWNHVVARTFYRPRDVISFLNSILEKAKERDLNALFIINQDIVAAREAYSKYLKQELDDEIKPHWQSWSESIQACSSIATITFSKSEFTSAYDIKRSPANPFPAGEALSMLYRFSVIGYETRSGYGGSRWVFQYTDPDAGWDSAADKFKVHLGLKEFARLREDRLLLSDSY